MINPPTLCFFTAKAIDEAAASVMMDISPGAAADIVEVTLLSDDFDSDIPAINRLDATVVKMTEKVNNLNVREKFNPLYIPVKMEEVDEMLDLSAKHDVVRFVGMDSNPYTVKQVDVETDGQRVISGKVQFYPFDLPHYSDIVEDHERNTIN